jgi:hypothetical protein
MGLLNLQQDTNYRIHKHLKIIVNLTGKILAISPFHRYTPYPSGGRLQKGLAWQRSTLENKKIGLHRPYA